MTDQLYGERVRTARAFSGIQSGELADSIGVSGEHLSRMVSVERRQADPHDPVVEGLARVTGFTQSFFFRSTPMAGEGDFLFRRRRTARLGEQRHAIAHGVLFAEAVDLLEAKLGSHGHELERPDIPPLAAIQRHDLEGVAETCRNHWGLGLDTPIENMMRVLESLAGAVVTRVPGLSQKIEAFSSAKRRPIVVLCSARGSASSDRWSCAHELAHLLLHANEQACEGRVEDEANRFAGAFLLPRRASGLWFPCNAVDWKALLDAKREWKASLAATLMRAFHLGLISNAERERAFKALSAKRWRESEPGEPVREEPEAFLNGLAGLDDVTPSDFAAELGWLPETFEAITGIAAASTSQAANVVSLNRFRAWRSREPSDD